MRNLKFVSLFSREAILIASQNNNLHFENLCTVYEGYKISLNH